MTACIFCSDAGEIAVLRVDGAWPRAICAACAFLLDHFRAARFEPLARLAALQVLAETEDILQAAAAS